MLLLLTRECHACLLQPAAVTLMPTPMWIMNSSLHSETNATCPAALLHGEPTLTLLPRIGQRCYDQGAFLTDTPGKQDRCCGCWCPPSVLAVLITPAELFLLGAVETVPASSQIGSDGKSLIEQPAIEGARHIDLILVLHNIDCL